jgi:acyl-CoA synthetase (AMP-forming)/AMP-acid ligase II
MSFAEIMRKGRQTFGDNVVVTFEGRNQTYTQMWDRACRLANALRDLGLQPGDRVAILADNQLEFVEQATALALAGLVRCPLYVMNTAPTNTYMLNLVGASAILVQGRYAADINALRDEVPSLRHLIVNGDGADVEGSLDYETLIAEASSEDPDGPFDLDADHIIRFSAGTTGRPKGIVHSVRGWLAMSHEFNLSLPPSTEDDSYLVASPMSHAAGLDLWDILATGGRYVILPGFEPKQYLDTIESERITRTMLVPTMIQMVAEVPGAYDRDLSSVKGISYGAAPITERALREGLRLWGNVMYQFYGQSEVLPGTVLVPADHHLEGDERLVGRLRSAGRPSPSVTVTIRDENDVVLAPGEVGEICIASPAQMKAIWGDPEATAARFTPDGAVRTRDMGYLDEDGFLFIVDRKEDMIISGGFNIWPLEVENALAEHPDVREVAVVGVPDEKWGESVFAVVKLAEGAQVSEQELIDWGRERVGSVKKPRSLRIVDESLPKSVVGKLMRRQVRELYWTPDA